MPIPQPHPMNWLAKLMAGETIRRSARSIVARCKTEISHTQVVDRIAKLHPDFDVEQIRAGVTDEFEHMLQNERR